MSWIAKDLPTLLMLLIPGFVAAGVFYTLTAHPKTSEFERVIQALIFTVFIKLGTIPIRVLCLEIGRTKYWKEFGIISEWTTDGELAASLVIAVALGLIFAAFANNDGFHSLFRLIRVTKRTSHPSEWYSSLANSRSWVVLHLEGCRRLRGWPLEWPDQADKGHFVILTPAWLLDDGSEALLLETEKLLVPAKSVEMVEFLKNAEDIPESPDILNDIRTRLVDLHRRSQDGVQPNGSESTTASAESAGGTS